VTDIDARRQRPIGATAGPLADFSPLVIATGPPLGDTYWLVSQFSALMIVTNPPQDPPFGPGASPGSGLFVTPTTAIGETLAQAQAGINLRTRLIGLDTWMTATFLPATGLYAVQMVWQDGPGPFVVPQGFSLVAICCPHPGTPTPGPGAGSSGQLNALVSAQAQT